MGPTSKTVVVLIRHPAPDGADGICYGRTELALRDPTEPARLAAALSGPRPATLWSSPSRRCLGLARRLGAPHRRAPRQDPRLLELDFGAWEARAWDDLPRDRLDSWARAPLSRGPTDGESVAFLIRRVRSFARELRRPGRHLVVAHAGPLLVLSQLLARRPIDLAAPRLGFGDSLAIASKGSALHPFQ